MHEQDETPSCRYVMNLDAHMHIEDLVVKVAVSYMCDECGWFQLSA